MTYGEKGKKRKLKMGTLLTDNQIDIYMLAYEERIQETEGLPWEERRDSAKDYADDIAPTVAGGLKETMKGRSPYGVSSLSEGSQKKINLLLGWKNRIRAEYDTDEKESTVPSNGSQPDANGLFIPHGYIAQWVAKWFETHDTLHARDIELADILGKSGGAFSGARRTLETQGYEFDHEYGGATVVKKRPLSGPTQEEVNGKLAKLSLLLTQIEAAKVELDKIMATN